ncbi:MAG: hypothetical protein CSA66_03070 [Proteobacteria bacterium]|nr:MAG: hypothetical protein CSA66_03070 [Pseudomonadota bacterium]
MVPPVAEQRATAVARQGAHALPRPGRLAGEVIHVEDGRHAPLYTACSPEPGAPEAMSRHLERRLLRLFSTLPRPLQQAVAWRREVDGQVLLPALTLGLAYLRLTSRPLEAAGVAAARASTRAQAADFGRPEPLPLSMVSEGTLPGPAGPLRYRRYYPAPRRPMEPVLLYFHGGGFVVGDLDTHDGVCRHLAARSGVQVIAVDYRLAPEAPFPAAFDDALAAFRWARDTGEAQGILCDRVAVGGDSAGGNLAAAVSLAAVRAGEPGPAFQLTLYPMVDAVERRRSFALFGDGFGLDVSTIDWFLDHYTGPDADRADLRLSPLLADDLSGLPPAYVAAAGFDPLRDEAAAWAQRLRGANVPVEYVCHQGLIHAFANLAAALPEAAEALDRAADALAAALR